MREVVIRRYVAHPVTQFDIQIVSVQLRGLCLSTLQMTSVKRWDEICRPFEIIVSVKCISHFKVSLLLLPPTVGTHVAGSCEGCILPIPSE